MVLFVFASLVSLSLFLDGNNLSRAQQITFYNVEFWMFSTRRTEQLSVAVELWANTVECS